MPERRGRLRSLFPMLTVTPSNTSSARRSSSGFEISIAPNATPVLPAHNSLPGQTSSIKQTHLMRFKELSSINIRGCGFV